MRKLYILLLLFLFSFSVFSQDGIQERAKKLSDEMTMVLSLDDKTSEKIYHIQLKRFIDAQRIRKEHQVNKKQMQTELRKLQNRLWGRLKGVLGEEKMKSWSMYKKSIQ